MPVHQIHEHNIRTIKILNLPTLWLCCTVYVWSIHLYIFCWHFSLCILRFLLLTKYVHCQYILIALIITTKNLKRQNKVPLRYCNRTEHTNIPLLVKCTHVWVYWCAMWPVSTVCCRAVCCEETSVYKAKSVNE